MDNNVFSCPAMSISGTFFLNQAPASVLDLPSHQFPSIRARTSVLSQMQVHPKNHGQSMYHSWVFFVFAALKWTGKYSSVLDTEFEDGYPRLIYSLERSKQSPVTTVELSTIYIFQMEAIAPAAINDQMLKRSPGPILSRK